MKLLKNKNFITCIILLVITFGTYQQVLKNEFVGIDDGKLIYQNKYVIDQTISLSKVITSKIFSPHYKPLTFLTWRAEYALVGENPFLFHLNNLLLYLGCVILIFFIGKKLFGRFFDDESKVFTSSFIFAILFALHPMHVESVAWAVERKDVLFSFLFLCSWLTYLVYLDKRKSSLLLVTAILYFLSMMSKSMGITLIAILFLTDFLYKRKLSLRLISEKLPALVVFLISAYLFGLIGNDKSLQHIAGLTSVVAEGQASGCDILDEFSPLVGRIVIIFTRFTLWLAHVLVPIKSALIYPKNDILNFFGKGLLVFPFLIGAIYSSILIFHKKVPALFWGLVFFGITISPAIAIDDNGFSVFLPDRYLYIPLIGIIFSLVILAMNLYDKYKKLVLGIFIAVSLWYGLITIDLVKVWENSGTLWSRPIELYSGNAEIINARAYRHNGEAEKAFDDEIFGPIHPIIAKAYHSRAVYYFSNKKFKEALSDFNSYLKYKGSDFDAEVFSNMGAAHSAIGEHEKALLYFNKAIELNSNYFFVYFNRSLTHKVLKMNDEELKDWTKCIELRPNDYTLYTERGIAYYNKKMFEKAAEDFTTAISLCSSNFECRDAGTLYLNRAFAYYSIGNIPLAKQDAVKAQELKVQVRTDFLEDVGVN